MIRKYFLAPAGVLALVVSLVDVVQAYDKELNLSIVSFSAGGSLPNGNMRFRYTRTGNRIKASLQISAGDGVNGTPFAAGVTADQLPSEVIPSNTQRIVCGEAPLGGGLRTDNNINYVASVESRGIGIWIQSAGDDRWYHSGDVTPAIKCNYDVDD